MFQGIVEQKGSILKRQNASIWVKPQRFWKAKKGDSVAVNGVCLTVADISKTSFRFDLGLETLSVTGLGALKEGDSVNLERPLRLGDPIHGHLVQGHVETTGEVISAAPILSVTFPAASNFFVIPKGSLAVDGVSLTINRISRKGKSLTAEFCLIPETLKRTNLSAKKPGDRVNLETDYLLKLFSVIPAKAGIQAWTPAFAGVTNKTRSTHGKN